MNPSISQSQHLHRTILTISLATTLLTSPIFAQTEAPLNPSATKRCNASADLSSRPKSAQSNDAAERPAVKPCPAKHHTETSFSLGAFSQLTATRIENSNSSFLTESLSPSAGVLGTVRQSFRPWLGYSVNMGYTRSSEHLTDYPNYGPSSSFDSVSIPANIYELSFSYLAQKHLNPRLTGFTDVGAGMLAFLPSDPNGGPVNLPVNFRPLGVGGVGIDYLLNPHFSFRAEYRGQLYKFADYGSESAKHLTVTSDPTLSLVYNLRKSKP